MDSLLLILMLIAVLGVGSQWVAWKFQLPAIVVMSVAGLLAGPILGQPGRLVIYTVISIAVNVKEV